MRSASLLALSPGRIQRKETVMTLQSAQEDQAEMSVRVLITDDHPAVRLALLLALEHFEDLSLVGEAVNCKETLTYCQDLKPDVLLLDLMMPLVDGESCLQLIREQSPDVRVIILTTFMNAGAADKLLAAGASGYLIKSIAIDRLADAIRRVYAGETVVIT
jgi:DNA-binding NarL/FixJ family response regulator